MRTKKGGEVVNRRALRVVIACFTLLGCLVLVVPLALESFLVLPCSTSQADAIVLMAGSRQVREPIASRLYRDGVAPKVLLKNDGVRADFSPKHGRNLYLVEWAKEDLVEKGVPEDAVVLLLYTASGTIHDVLNTREYVRVHPEIRRLLVVTSDYHTRRTLWTFQRVFEEEKIQIGVYPVTNPSEIWWRRIFLLYVEIIKYIYYNMNY